MKHFDNNGNTLTSVTGSNTTNYVWDFENRMTSVTLPGSGGTVSFAYDPFGRRIKKVTSSTTSIFAYDGDNLLEETNSSGTAVARYSQTQNIDEPLAMLRSGATSYFHADGLGSVTSLSSSTGSVANTYTYDSFGNLTASTGSLVNPFQYTARESDTETGLYYYRARYYDQNAGRFLSEDPIRFKTGVDFYRYVRNRPTSLVDWSGLSPATCGCNILTRIAQGAAIGTVGGAIVGGVSGGLAGAVGGGAAGTLALPGGGTLAGGAVGAAEGAAGGAWLGSRVGAFLGSAIGAIVGTVECLNNNEDSCWVQYENDVSLCRTLPSSGARARCYASAMQRYANCRAGREPGPLVDE